MPSVGNTPMKANHVLDLAVIALATIVAFSIQLQSSRADSSPPLTEIIRTLENQRETIKSLLIETKEYLTFAADPSEQARWPQFAAVDHPTFQASEVFAFRAGKRYRRTVQTVAEKPCHSDTIEGRCVLLNDQQGDDLRVFWERNVNLKRGPAQITVFLSTVEYKWIDIPDYCGCIGWDCNAERYL